MDLVLWFDYLMLELVICFGFFFFFFFFSFFGWDLFVLVSDMGVFLVSNDAFDD